MDEIELESHLEIVCLKIKTFKSAIEQVDKFYEISPKYFSLDESGMICKMTKDLKEMLSSARKERATLDDALIDAAESHEN